MTTAESPAIRRALRWPPSRYRFLLLAQAVPIAGFAAAGLAPF